MVVAVDGLELWQLQAVAAVAAVVCLTLGCGQWPRVEGAAFSGGSSVICGR